MEKNYSEILRKTQSEIKFAHIRKANTSLRSNFTLRSKISLAQRANFTEKRHAKESEESVCVEISADADVKLWQKP